jgi:hypothetical protein
MPEDGLDRFVIHFQPMQVSCKPTPECVPAVPLDMGRLENGLDDAPIQLIQIKRLSQRVG